MNNKDLMIGDWVNLYGSPIKINIDDLGVIEREEIYDKYDKGTHCKPIELTEEILEKNGFGFIDTSNNEYSSVWTGWWILDGLELGCCDNSKFPVFFNIADTNVKVNYVHELQHALRLCKIEKDIKIKFHKYNK